MTLIPVTDIRTADYCDQYERADENYKEGFLQCPICGKNANWDSSQKAGRVLRLVGGGSLLTDVTDDEPHADDAGDMGCWPVGVTCWKKWLAMKATGKYESER